MQSKLITVLAVVSLLIAITTEVILLRMTSEYDELAKQAALTAKQLAAAQAEITQLNSAIEGQKVELASERTQLETQFAINAELLKTSETEKARCKLAAPKPLAPKQRAVPQLKIP